MKTSFSLAGRTALITGASSGLGAHFATVFARAGARVALGARRIDRVEALAAQLAADGTQAMAVRLDVTDEASIKRASDAAEARFGTVDTIVANAGTKPDRPGGRVQRRDHSDTTREEDRFAATPWEAWDTGVPLVKHALASFECARHAVYEGGDHVILVGRVIRVRFEPRRDPLLYFRGRYRRLHFS